MAKTLTWNLARDLAKILTGKTARDLAKRLAKNHTRKAVTKGGDYPHDNGHHGSNVKTETGSNIQHMSRGCPRTTPGGAPGTSPRTRQDPHQEARQGPPEMQKQ